MMAITLLLLAPFTNTPLSKYPMLFSSSLIILWYSPTLLTLSTLIDNISSMLLGMTLILTMLMLKSSQKESFNLTMVFMCLMLTLWCMMTTYSVLYFYIWFELSLVPMILIILGWGKQPERLLASLYMLIYTMTGSLPFLLIILYTHWATLDPHNLLVQPFIVGVSVLLPFCVKLPLFYLHLWLPKAHVEAPVFGSMILAATLLKIGCYGVWRLVCLLPMSVTLPMISISLTGATICCWVAMTQTDIKALIAFSSVVHMGMVLSSILMSRNYSCSPALMMMISHGICSSGLFYSVTLMYERTTTRSLPVMQGLMCISPALALPWVLMILMNLSAPPTLSLVSEVFMSGSVLYSDWVLMLSVAFMIILVLAYSLLLFTSVSHGQVGFTVCQYHDSNKELFITHAHSLWFSLWVMGLWLYLTP